MSGSLPRDDLADVTCDAEADLRTLAGASLLITGATGFFGRWLVASFAHANSTLRLGAQCTALARRASVLRELDPELASDPSIALVDGDVRTWESPGPFTHVVHAATASGGDVHATLATIVDGTRNILAQSRAWGARVLFTSSGAVYGPQPPELSHVGEDYRGGPDPLDPASAYGESKRYAELCCALADTEVTIARGFAFAGPLLPLDANYAFGNFIGNGLRGEPIVVHGDGTPLRSYLYAADLTRWLWAILARGAAGRAYNVGSERAISIGDLAKLIGATFNVPVEIRGQSSPPARYVPSTRRAREELGLTARVELEDAIARTALWHRHRGGR